MQRATMRAEMLGAENDQLAEQLAAFKRAARQEIMRSGGSPSSCVGGAPTAVATVPVLQPHPNYELEPEPEPEPLLAAAGDDMAVSSGGAVEDWRVTGDRLQPLHSLPYEGPLKKDGTPDKRTKAYKQWQAGAGKCTSSGGYASTMGRGKAAAAAAEGRRGDGR
jgi:hypothetical protein